MAKEDRLSFWVRNIDVLHDYNSVPRNRTDQEEFLNKLGYNRLNLRNDLDSYTQLNRCNDQQIYTVANRLFIEGQGYIPAVEEEIKDRKIRSVEKAYHQHLCDIFNIPVKERYHTDWRDLEAQILD